MLMYVYAYTSVCIIRYKECGQAVAEDLSGQLEGQRSDLVPRARGQE